MKKTIAAMLAYILFAFIPAITANGQTRSQERVKDDALVSLLLPQLNQAVGGQFSCKRVRQIRQLERGNRFFEVEIDVITHTGPHNPPNDLVTVTIRKDNSGIRVTNVKRMRNVSSATVRRVCLS